MSAASREAARVVWEYLNSTVGARDALGIEPAITRVEILEPPRELEENGAHSAVVVYLADGTRWGMEVCPFPQLPPQGPATVRGIDGAKEGA